MARKGYSDKDWLKLLREIELPFHQERVLSQHGSIGRAVLRLKRT